jgi:hypothetical protein
MTDDELQNLQDYLMGIFNIRNGLHEFDEEIIIDDDHEEGHNKTSETVTLRYPKAFNAFGQT